MPVHRTFICVLTGLILISGCRHREPEPVLIDFQGKPQTPGFIISEHDRLLKEVQQYAESNDSVKWLAVQLLEVMQHHFDEEEAYVLPVLGILPLLEEGIMPEQADSIIMMTELFKSRRMHFDAEHQMIKACLFGMRNSPGIEAFPGFDELEQSILLHAREEEAVYFPACLMTGELLKTKIKK